MGGASRSWVLLALFVVLSSSTALAMAGSGKRGVQSCLGRAATLTATPGKELIGSPTGDVIVGSSSVDRIDGAGGDDLICSGPGADVVLGGGGDDRVAGGGGGDLLRGGAGDDRIHGGRGRDRCLGGAGSNKLASCEKGKSPKTRRINRVPLTENATAVTSEDSPTSIEATAVASDDDGDSLSFASLDAGGSAASVGIVDGGTRLRFDPSGQFDSLAAGQGIDQSVQYVIADGHGAFASGKLTVTVGGVDDAPGAIGDEEAVEQGAAATVLPVRANDTDIDGGPKLVASVTQPANGTATVAGDGLDLTYQPNPGYCNDGEAPDSFTYTLNGGSTATIAVAVACVSSVVLDQGGLSPAFDPSVPDYTVRCNGSPLAVSGRLAQGTTISIDGGAEKTGVFEETVPLEENQEFSFALDDGLAIGDYHVRCLPSDFPAWEYTRLLQPGRQFYVVDPAIGAGGNGYAIVFDDNGVPVWWQGSNPGPIDAKFIAEAGQPTRITWWGQFGGADGYQIRELDGTVVRTVSIVGGSTDIHELQRAPNGNYLVTSYQPREHADLTAFGGGADDTVIDAEVQEINQTGEAVWAWNSATHISLEETGRWWPTVLKNAQRDIVHMNAVEPVGDDAILISMRHNDAIYKIDKTSGDVVWKLGGTWTPQSLTVVGDPEGAYPLGGQHDMRLQPDGTITIHDNNTNQPSPPRAVRYKIDEAAKTATLVEQVTDPEAPGSFCCGSSRRFADGSWLMSWGGRSLVTEFNSAGERTFRLSFGGIAFSYRAVAAPDGALSAAELRTGMDAMHPRTP
ncbi:MAG TPA: aryl-sulfate sulfotransferase [Solirubrobacterales bacterium]|nr:aryl-sulfate sulfotransferase [Solirubrobacterales bacterium]